MIAADIEFMACERKMELAEERRELRRREFWLSVREETGLDEHADLTFDPLHLRVLSKGNKEIPKQLGSDSHSQSLERYRGLVKAALDNPLIASRMANAFASGS